MIIRLLRQPDATCSSKSNKLDIKVTFTYHLAFVYFPPGYHMSQNTARVSLGFLSHFHHDNSPRQSRIPDRAKGAHTPLLQPPNNHSSNLLVT